jgi:hypothetical protein
MLALLMGVVAATAKAQTDPYGTPPGGQTPYDNSWREPAAPYDRQPDNGYDRQPDNGYDRQPDNGYDRQPDGGYDRRPDGGYDREQAPAVDVGFFYNELSPFGEWVRHPQYGWAWFPRNVRAGWRPYSLGRWVESDYGWTWASDEPFGWATYHYGRWAWDSQVGWLWVPGTDWGPAWVAWQQGNGYVGWAPLPPAVGFEIGVGIRLGGFNLSLGIAPRDYAFVEERRFLDPRIGGYIVPEARNITIIHNTTNITDYTVVNNRVINRGVPIDRIERATGRRAPRLRVATAPNPRGGGVQRDVISIYRPTERNLETVRVARRNNAGLPPAPSQPNRTETQPPAARPPTVAPFRPGTASVPIPVAPRTRPAPQGDNERQFAREQRDLQTSQERDRRALEQIHRQEVTKEPARANSQEMVQRQAAEVQAQREQRQHGEQQLQTRQQIQRQAAQASVAKDNKPQKPPAEADKPKNKNKKEKKDHDPQPPPSR